MSERQRSDALAFDGAKGAKAMSVAGAGAHMVENARNQARGRRVDRRVRARGRTHGKRVKDAAEDGADGHVQLVLQDGRPIVGGDLHDHGKGGRRVRQDGQQNHGVRGKDDLCAHGPATGG